MKTVFIDNYTYLIGTNEKENWCLLDNSHENDIFFHLTSFPSCYVILKNRDGTPLNDVIEEEKIIAGARLCLLNTKFKNAKNIYIDCTNIGNLKKGEKMGEVVYISSRSVRKIML